ncbi:MAG: hypothetical protein WCP20_22600 [Desulfuromonadales bacterium]
MKKVLAICLLVMLLCAGCATVTVETVTPPSFSFKPDLSIPLKSPSTQQKVRYIPKDGLGKATQDNVTVEVSDIVSTSSESDFTIKIKDGETEHNFSVFPMLLVLKITNATDHIVTLERTIVKIEDDNQNDYPMINSISEIKRQANAEIAKLYADNLNQIKKINLEDLKDKINSIYKPQYDQFAQDVRAKIAQGVEIRFPETRPGYHVTMQGINDSLKNYSPAELYARNKKLLDASNSGVASAMEKIKNFHAQQIDKKIPETLKGVITSGIYQPINILPGRSEKVLVPFSKRKEDEIINKINIGIYDLPTMVNEAGVPTKRAKFNFEMVATQQ